MNFQTAYATPKAGLKRVIASGRTYRTMTITQTEYGYIVNGHPFATLKQAMDYIDTCFSTNAPTK